MAGMNRVFGAVLAALLLSGAMVNVAARPQPDPQERVTLCHKPGTPAEKTLTLPPAAVAAHIRHGDTRGACTPAPPPPPALQTCGGQPATIVGTPGDDVLDGTAGPDVIVGLGGNDVITGLGGNDRICSGAGDDSLVGGENDDYLSAGPGFDTIDGGPGVDTCLVGEQVSNCEDALEVLEGAALARITADADGDGISDEREELLATDPANADTDRDGFPDVLEDRYTDFGFDPLVVTRDDDRDGLADALEAALATSPAQPDTDGDGWSDLDEVAHGSFGFNPVTPTADADFDGLSDSLEASLGTRSDLIDSDSDGVSDFEEHLAGLNPAEPDPPGSFIELVGGTASAAMRRAVETVRAGGVFPVALAGELPFPELTRALVSAGVVRPSAALMQAAMSPTDIYDRYAEIVGALRSIAERHPGIVRVVDFAAGVTVEGRRIYAVKISDNPGRPEPEETLKFLFMGLHHARELVTASIAVGFIRELTDRYANGDPDTVGRVDISETIVIPVVNPDGYEIALGRHRNWRKNSRRVATLNPNGTRQSPERRGVDPNRNYGFEHISTLNDAQRATLEPKIARERNGLDKAGRFNPENETFANVVPFSEVETRTVGLFAMQLVAGTDPNRSDRCSLSWHTNGGEVTHPMGHTTANGLTPIDVIRFQRVSREVERETGYRNLADRFKDDHYPTYGDSDDWLYKAQAFLALTVEALSGAENDASGSEFYPGTAPARDAVVRNNVNGAFALMRSCRT